jgi:hypothetical protein
MSQTDEKKKMGSTLIGSLEENKTYFQYRLHRKLIIKTDSKWHALIDYGMKSLCKVYVCIHHHASIFK